MFKITVLAALAVASLIANHGLHASSLAWLVAPPPSGNTFGAAR